MFMSFKIFKILLFTMFFSSCKQWNKIDVDLKSPSLQYAFNLQTGEHIHNIRRINNVLSITTGVKDNKECCHILNNENNNAIKIENLIQRIVDTGEFTDHRPFHSDSFKNYLIETSSSTPKMHFSIINGESFTWYYLHDKEVGEAGLHQIAIELDEIFVRIKKEIKKQ